MSSQNGHSRNGNGVAKVIAVKKPAGNQIGNPLFDQENGNFAVGNPGGPGRPKGTLDLMKIVREQARRSGHSLDKCVEIAMRALVRSAAAQDVNAIKVLLDRLCGPQDKGTTVNVGIDARGATAGPTMPEGADFMDYIEKLNRVAATQGLLGDTTPEQLVEDAAQAAVDEQDEREELLS